MRSRLSSRSSITIGATILLLPISASIGQPPQQHCSINVFLSVSQLSLSGRPAMVSAIRDGRIVQQGERNLSTGMELNTDSIKPGVGRACISSNTRPARSRARKWPRDSPSSSHRWPSS